MLSASAAFANSDNATLSEVSDEMPVEENVLSCADDSTAIKSSDDSTAYSDEAGNVVINDTFFNYFDKQGVLRDNVTYDELIFWGEFEDFYGISQVTINRPITFTGNGDAVFNGMGIVINSSDVNLNGFSVFQKNTPYGIIINGDNIVISNNYLEFTSNADLDSYGIYAKAPDNLQIIDNTIVYDGNTNGTVVNNPVRIEGDDKEGTPASSIVVSGNAFDFYLPSVDVSYDKDTWASTVWTEGIVFYYCEDLQFTDNRVNLKYGDVTTAYGYDTLFAVSVRSDAYSFRDVQSSDVLIANNTIFIEGYDCAYAVYVCADEFEVYGNNITSISENYLAHGIDIDGPSSSGSVGYNKIVVAGPDAYGIYSYQYLGAIEDIEYCNNAISVDGYLSGGMEIVECNPTIVSNTIYANGNYTYGIVTSIRDSGIITGNEIIVLGTNVGDDPTGDPLMPKNSMGISIKGEAVIRDNYISSSNIGINIAEKGGVVIDYNTIGVITGSALIDSYGIYAKDVDNITIINNDILFESDVGGVINNGIRIEGDEDELFPATNIVVTGNAFDFYLPSVDERYNQDTGDAIAMSEGIVFYYCEDLEFVDNIIDLEYYTVTTAHGYDSIYAVSVRSDEDASSKDVLIANNTIEVEGHAFAYGITVAAEGFEVSGNNITLTSEINLGHGIDVAEPSFYGLVDDNIISVNAPSAYGIFSDGSRSDSVDTVTYSNNKIDVHGYLADAFELVQNNPCVINNTLYATGNYTYGVVVSIYDDGEISGNEIIVLGTNVGDDPTGDPLTPKNSMAISVKGNSTIADNVIESTDIGIKYHEGTATIIDNNIKTASNYTVDMADSDGTVHDNYLIAKKLFGDYSVYFTGAATVYDNLPIMIVTLSASDLEKIYGDGQLFIVTAYDEFGDPVNNVTLYACIENLSFKATTDENGVAEFNIELPQGKYDVTTKYRDTKFYVEDIENNLTVTAKETEFIADNLTVSLSDVIDGTYSNLTLSDGNKGLGNKTIAVKFNSQTENFTTDKNGLVSYRLPLVSDGNYTIEMIFDGDGCYCASNLTVSVEIYKWESFVSAEDISVTYGADITVPVTSINATGIAYQIIDDNNENVANGTIKAGEDITGLVLDVGKYTVNLTTITDIIYYSANNVSKITVKPAHSSVSAEDVSVTLGEEITIPVTSINATGIDYQILDKNNKIVANGTIKAGEDITGLALAVGKYTVNLTTITDSNHVSVNNVSKITVNRAPSFVSAEDVSVTYGDEVTVPVTSINATQITYQIIDENNEVVANGTIKVGEDITGLALAAGEYTVNLTTITDSNHVSVNNVSKITVDRAPSFVSAEDVSVIYGEEIRIKVTSIGAISVNYQIIDEKGKIVVNGTVEPGVLSILRGLDSSNGIISGLKLSVGDYKVNLTTVPEDNYVTANYVSTLTVNRANSSVNVEDIEVNVGDSIIIPVTSENATSITYAIIDEDGNIVVNGTIQPGENIIVPDLPAGNYIVNVTANTNGNYSSSAKTATLAVNKIPSSIVLNASDIYVSEKGVIDIYVGADDAGGSVNVTVGSKDYNDIPVVNGVAQVIVSKLSAGEYEVHVTYSGDDKYLPSNLTTTFEVKKVTPSIVSKLSDGKLIIDLPDDATGSVRIEIDGKTYTQPVINGKAVFDLSSIKAGSYEIKIYYSGDEKYVPINTTDTIKVLANENNTQKNKIEHLKTESGVNETGNPIIALLFAFVALGFTQLRRFGR